MVDARDIANVVALDLIRCDTATEKLPIETINLAGPDTMTSDEVACIWSEVLGRTVVYGGDYLSGFAANMASFMREWQAYEMRLIAERHVKDGMIPAEGERKRLEAMLGRPLHSYRELAAPIAT